MRSDELNNWLLLRSLPIKNYGYAGGLNFT